MTDDNTLKEFEEMFDLPTDVDDGNEQAEEYGHSIKNDDSFESLVKDVSEEVAQCPDKGAELEVESVKATVEDPHDIVKDVCSKSIEDTEMPVPEPVIEPEPKSEPKSEAVGQEEDFDTLPEQKISKKEIIEEINEVHKQMAHIPNKETVETFENTDQGKDLNPVASIEARGDAVVEIEKS